MMTEDELADLFVSCSNEGRWGADDQSGTLNLITDEKRREAAALVQKGTSIALGRTLVPGQGVVAPHPVTAHLLNSAVTTAVDLISFTPHDPMITHIDTLGHAFWQGRGYNGRLREDVVLRSSLAFGTTAGYKDGIFTRGVLLDVAAARGVDYLAADEFVTVDDLLECERRQGIQLTEGDAIIVNTGRERRSRVEEDYSPIIRAGVDGSVLPYLYERGVAVWTGDCTERFPFPSERVPMPLHMVGIVAIGLCLVDAPDIDELVDFCTASGRWDFLFTVAPVDVQGSTGFPVNPLCVF